MFALSELARKKLSSFAARDIAMTVNALAKRNIRNPKCFEEMGEAAIGIVGTFNSQDIANVLNAFAKMEHRHPELFDAVAKAA
eukprot:CAMPEP_0113623354 /NCGR_PEP_ID=MMETSP0017_2-20120614/12009_1 /TAXON_ID=2856 /ORGANISM="Cylindrotheca closterium" /LENGTH=82 /DNA_ID=CAMNT_0000533291 /DNA_START=94 /DNA_END=338 /DNA_ORIENTATION=- /assembly_acc=CAM_ASM_000147